MNNNFYCPKTKKEFFIPEYRTIIDKSGNTIFKDKNGNILTNPDNGEKLLEIKREHKWKDGDKFFIGLGNSKEDRLKRTEMLKKRSKEHFKKKISEKKYEMNKGLIKSFENQ